MSPEDAFEAATLGAIPPEFGRATTDDAPLLQHAQHLAAQLSSALETRAVVDQAIGVIMGRGGRTEREALDSLRALSQTRQEELAVVARRIIERAAHPAS